MTRDWTHRTLDRLNFEQDRMIAAKLRRDRTVLAAAQRNLRRWMARDGRNLRSVFREWSLILSRLSRAEIVDFLRADTPMARRLRQSSPFAGTLSWEERMAIRRRHEKARA